MPFRDTQKERDYKRGWFQRKRHGLPTRLHEKLTPEERKKRRRESHQKSCAKARKKADEVFGTKCCLCHNRKTNRTLVLHEIHGKPHGDACSAFKALKKPQDWRRLCYSCHKSVHWVMRYFGMTWEEIEAKFRLQIPCGWGSIPHCSARLYG